MENWFLRTDDANDNTSFVLAPCWSLSTIFSLTPAYVSKVHHISYFTYWLAAETLDIPLTMLMMLLEKIPMRECLCEVVWCIMKPLSVVGGCVWIFLWGIYLSGGSPLRVNPWWYFCYLDVLGVYGYLIVDKGPSQTPRKRVMGFLFDWVEWGIVHPP